LTYAPRKNCRFRIADFGLVEDVDSVLSSVLRCLLDPQKRIRGSPTQRRKADGNAAVSSIRNPQSPIRNVLAASTGVAPAFPALTRQCLHCFGLEAKFHCGMRIADCGIVEGVSSRPSPFLRGTLEQPQGRGRHRTRSSIRNPKSAIHNGVSGPPRGRTSLVGFGDRPGRWTAARMKRLAGIAPASPVWKTGTLLLS
jgi:hypothetical protein